MKIAKAIILTEDDVRDFKPACGTAVDVILVPENMKDEYLKSKAHRCLFPCVANSKLEQKIITYKVLESE